MIMIKKKVIDRQDLSSPLKQITQVKYYIFGIPILSVTLESSSCL